ncbi:MAG: hypothetical protein M1829_002846 [Trizodia sp. TS-e1964]|nr:MAG: hypothetical protein M1829_002846 [Trizodia sp. TS-e1964]
MSGQSIEIIAKAGAIQYAQKWGESPLPPMVLATLITAQSLRPLRPLPLLFTPMLLLSTYMNLDGHPRQAALQSASWSAIYLVLARRRKQAFMSKWSARGIVRGTTMGVCVANLLGGGVAYWLNTDMLCRSIKYHLPSNSARITIFSRSIHLYRGIGKFVNIDESGKQITQDVKLIYGSPTQSFILISPEIGHALQAGGGGKPPISVSMEDKNQPTHPLTFFDKTRSFAHDEHSPQFPRLEIPFDLPKQSSGETSSATIFLSGVSHEIALDGTPDAAFAALARESIELLQPAMDKLKNM